MEPNPSYKYTSKNLPLRNQVIPNEPQIPFLPQMAKWGKHITLILIFWPFDNRQPLVLFPQPSNRPYLHIAGLIDFSPERMHYSQVINCLKLFLNENAGNLQSSFLNGSGQDNFQTVIIRDSFNCLIPPSSTMLLTSRAACQNQGLTLFMLFQFYAADESFFPTTSPCSVQFLLPNITLPACFLFPQHLVELSSPQSSYSSSDYYIINNNL